MMRRPALVALVLVGMALAAPASAESRIDCSSIQSRILKQSVRYCVFLPEGYDSAPTRRYPILYFLHGLGDNEQTLINTGAYGILDTLRQQHKIGDFLVAAPAGKRDFYINSADGKVMYGDFLLREFIPAMEARYRVRSGRGSRGVTGMSMGGYGALRLAFANPALFSSVSAQGAALITESPQQINKTLRSGSPLGRMFGGTFGMPVDVPHWQRNNPFVLARKNHAALRDLAIYFNCGDVDEYGFENGAAALHRQLEKEDITHEYHLYAGNHSLGYFLEHFGETMVFHSRAFDAAQRPRP